GQVAAVKPVGTLRTPWGNASEADHHGLSRYAKFWEPVYRQDQLHPRVYADPAEHLGVAAFAADECACPEPVFLGDGPIQHRDGGHQRKHQPVHAACRAGRRLGAEPTGALPKYLRAADEQLGAAGWVLQLV